MKLTVRFLGLDKEGNDVDRGSVTWDGQRLSWEPPEVVRFIEPVGRNVGGHWIEFDPLRQPVEWLKALQFHYHGAYLRATAPEQS